MNPLRDLGWPHLVPTEKLHAVRSTPSLKTSLRRILRAENSDPSFRRSIGRENGFCEQSLRAVSPRPELDSSILPPELPLEELSKPLVVSQSISDEDLLDDDRVSSTGRPSSPISATTALSNQLYCLKPVDTGVAERDMDSISPQSDAMNDLIQSMPDSPLWEGPCASTQLDGFSIVVDQPHITVQEPSMDGPLDIPKPLADVSNEAAMHPIIKTAIREQSTLLDKNVPSSSFDGPISDMPSKKRQVLAQSPGCPLILEEPTSRNATFLTTKNTVGCSDLSVNGIQDATTAPGASAIVEVPAVLAVSEVPAILTSPDLSNNLDLPIKAASPIPGIPYDVTGVAICPPTPPSRHKGRKTAKTNLQRTMRKTRRFILRKSVLSIVLGRELSGPTFDMLKLISKGATPKEAVGEVTSRVNSAAPVLVPVAAAMAAPVAAPPIAAPIPAPVPIPVQYAR